MSTLLDYIVANSALPIGYGHTVLEHLTNPKQTGAAILAVEITVILDDSPIDITVQ